MLVLPLIATWLGICIWLLPIPIICITIAGFDVFDRKCTEMGLSLKHRLKRLYPPSSEGGDDDNKCSYELDHGYVRVLSPWVSRTVIFILVSSVTDHSWKEDRFYAKIVRTRNKIYRGQICFGKSWIYGWDATCRHMEHVPFFISTYVAVWCRRTSRSEPVAQKEQATDEGE